MNQSRWRSPVAWSAVVALVLFVLKNYGLLAPVGLTEDSFKELTALIFGVLSAFAFFNDPTSKDSF
ncbi:MULTISPECIES: holin [Pseudobacteroides]|uniref:Holin phage phi LC3 n=1 Tax=Pseudobacteroides cellulosolvens ATCC 35603 = DSM 2933 TaxID=398512 RepID=A0A0L6JUA6_9FIRM|nr:holin [Pseudobacteroides cellulosolvens]KNY29012.1 Holin phage phi LC3 [Pseudobacteroides cellulosolvens ATCC 35603 = DSM 2933]